MPFPDEVRVGVLIDWQNCYRSARDAFGFDKSAPGKCGQVDPVKLARLLATANGRGGSGKLSKVRVYTGVASQQRDPQTYAASRRHHQAWRNAGGEQIEVITRTLNYRTKPPREKGVDVAIAIDLVRTTLFEPEHDVVVLWSADTDLLPAIELIASRGKRIEVATWAGERCPPPLSVKGHALRTHRLNRRIYDSVHDPQSYASR